MTSTGRITSNEVSFEYPDGQRVLQHVSFTISPAEVVAFVGPSGSGKTTIVRLIAGFLFPTAGEIQLDGKPVAKPDGSRAVAFQSDSVFPWMTVLRNIAFAVCPRTAFSKSNIRIGRDLIAAVGLSGFENNFPKALSGGMRKRVEVARIFAADAKVLLLDEAFGSLDMLTKRKIHQVVQQLLAARPRTTIVVTHDIEEAAFLADRIYVLQPQRPCATLTEIKVPFERPRPDNLRYDPEFLKLRREIEEQVLVSA